MKKKVLIAIAVFAVTAPTLWSIFGPGRIWIFITSQELEDLYPDKTPKEREDLIRKNTELFL